MFVFCSYLPSFSLSLLFQLRLALGDRPGSVTVMYSTQLNQPAGVQYGKSPSQLTASAVGTSFNYTPHSYQHVVQLPPLPASTQFFYRAGSDAAGWSRVFSFTSPRTSGSAAPLSLAIYGDMGITNSEATVAALIEAKAAAEFDAVLHVGDFAYADDRLDSKKFEEVWDQWQASIEPVAATTPYMVVPGNHEASCHSFGDFFCAPSAQNFTAYNHRFAMPSKSSNGSLNMWYSFDIGFAHFVMLSTEVDIGPQSPEGPHTLWKAGNFGNQLAWLQQDLARAKGNPNTPWIVVTGHRPMCECEGV